MAVLRNPFKLGKGVSGVRRVCDGALACAWRAGPRESLGNFVPCIVRECRAVYRSNVRRSKRPVFSTRWMFCPLEGRFAGGFFQWLEGSGRWEACRREDSPTDWVFSDFRMLIDGLILPLTGGMGTLKGRFAGGLFHRLGVFALWEVWWRGDSSTGWKFWMLLVALAVNVLNKC